MVSSVDMEPTMFGSMREAAKAINMEEGIIRYTKNNGRDFMRRFEGGSINPRLPKVFFIHTLTQEG